MHKQATKSREQRKGMAQWGKNTYKREGLTRTKEGKSFYKELQKLEQEEQKKP